MNFAEALNLNAKRPWLINVHHSGSTTREKQIAFAVRDG